MPRPRSASADSHRRARMYVQGHLGWLRGFPEVADGALRWWRLDEAEPIAVDGALRHRAQRALRTVLRDHADALPRLVGDVEGWTEAVEAVLASLAGSRPTPPAWRTRGDEPVAALRPLLDAAAFALATEPAAQRATRRWIAEHEHALIELTAALPGATGIAAALRLAALAREHGDAVDPLSAWASYDMPDPAVALQHIHDLIGLVRGAKAPVTAPAPVAARIAGWLPWLYTADGSTQRRALALIGALLDRPLFDAWHAWWNGHRELNARARNLVERAAPRAQDARNACIAALEDAHGTHPPVFTTRDVLTAITAAASPDEARRFPALHRLLTSLPVRDERNALRATILPRWVGAVAHGDRAALTLWKAIGAQIARGAPADAMLATWRSYLRNQLRTTLPGGWLVDDMSLAAIERFAAAQGEMMRAGIDGYLHFSAILATCGGSPAFIVEVARAIAAHGDHYLEPTLLTAAYNLGAPDAAATAARVIELLEATKDRAWTERAGLVTLVEHLGRRGSWITREMIAAGRSGALIDAGTALHRLPKSLRPPALLSTASTAWIARYPDALTAALEHLAVARPDAEDAALRVLARDFPDPAALRRELDALAARPALIPAQAARVRTIEAILRAPRMPSPARLARLARKIERAAAEAAIARIGTSAIERTVSRLLASVSLETIPDAWRSDPKLLDRLGALAELEPSKRAVAGRLLRARMGDRPWDLRDERPNRRFLDELRRRGIDPVPWLDPTPRTVDGGSGPITLALCDDPLDVLAMGDHFETCLAAGGVNYFSTVANAADINKRVLYARRANGTVAGRCLLALTDAGGLLTFHAYAHDGEDRMQALVAAFVKGLAVRMGTTVVPRGAVSTLVADEWYDDGPRDLVDSFPALRDDSELRTALVTIDPDDAPALIRTHLGRDLDDLTLPMILALPEVLARAPLILALAQRVRQWSTVPVHAVVTVATAALAAGDRALADRLAGERAVAAVRESFEHSGFVDLLGQLRPSTLLAIIRETRPRGVRAWRDENASRLVQAGRALEALHRPAQAAAMYRLAIPKLPRAAAGPWRERLRALERR